MNDISKKEDEWQAAATAATIAEARKIVLANVPLTTARVSDLTDSEWGWIVAAAIFGWIRPRHEQAIAEGFEQEPHIVHMFSIPTPSDTAVVRSILPALAEVPIDWSQALSAWSKDAMVNFLLQAWELLCQAESARNCGAGKIIRPSKRPSAWNDKEGDPIPFDP
jgi:hypothetical protein